MKRVVIVCKSLPHYRVELLNRLRDRLLLSSIQLEVLYSVIETDRKDTVRLEWGKEIESLHVGFGRKKMLWQRCLKYLEGADLVIVEQANKLLVNYVLLFTQLYRVRKIAFWGHGRNFQSKNYLSIGEKIKLLVSKSPSWWFAYTKQSSMVLEDIGYPIDRITQVNNAVDTSRLVEIYSKVTVDDLAALRSDLGLRGNNIGIYIGSLYREKRIDLLLEASELIRKKIHDFELVVIGAGEEQARLERFSKDYDWVKYIGPKFGDEKAEYLKLAKVFLHPGVIGLGILDAFATNTPIVTIEQLGHGPEISYLTSGENGWLTSEGASTETYAKDVIDIISNRDKLKIMQNGCERAAKIYTLKAMVENFSSGIEKALHFEAGRKI